MCANRLSLEAGLNPERVIEQLLSIPGIGKWTAHYIAMRALRWPDAFPKEDVALLKRLGGITAGKAEEMSPPWRPWRSYATLQSCIAKQLSSKGLTEISPSEQLFTQSFCV